MSAVNSWLSLPKIVLLSEMLVAKTAEMGSGSQSVNATFDPGAAPASRLAWVALDTGGAGVATQYASYCHPSVSVKSTVAA